MKKVYQSVLLVLFLTISAVSFSQVPVLNSYPSAAPTIFLDFDGQYVSGTSWNWNGPINCAPSNLTTDKIMEVFDRVAEDYRPFNINVTTDSTVFFNAPVKQRMRVILTITHSWYGTTAGGVANIGSFAWGTNTPCFVFTRLHNYKVKNIAEAASHEAGHTLGLRHQAVYDANCVRTSDYNWGTGSGEIGWAPIMGAGYNQNFTVWHYGQNSVGCTSYQSDLDVITRASNGVTFRTDDHADVAESATVISLENEIAPSAINNPNIEESALSGDVIFDVSGVISQTNDRDMFRFTIDQISHFQLYADPYNVGMNNSGSDLDMQVQLLDGALNVVGSYNPSTLLNSIIDTSLNPGTYYLIIDGQGNLYASEYGSLGSYSMEGALASLTPMPLRELSLKGSAENGKHQLNWVIDADEKVVRQVIETSMDGINFAPLAEAKQGDRAYSYIPLSGGTAQYRVHVTFDNNKQHYSNTIALKANSTKGKPQLTTNMITGNVLAINSPSVFAYSIIDYGGKQLAGGQISKGSSAVQIGALANGMYLIRFSNGQEEYVEKFVKK